jgi:hypothetical protein
MRADAEQLPNIRSTIHELYAATGRGLPRNRDIRICDIHS